MLTPFQPESYVDFSQEAPRRAMLEALKMEHQVRTEVAGVVREIALEVGDTIFEDTPIVFIEPPVNRKLRHGEHAHDALSKNIGSPRENFNPS